jgi:hypothetical protein
MKKTHALVTALALSVSAFAQAPKEDNYLFNHWSVGAGFLFDLNGQVATTITPNLQLRLVYDSYSHFLWIGNMFTKDIAEVGSLTPYVHSFPVGDNGVHTNGINIDDIVVTGKLNTANLNLLLDYFPGKSSFHFTGGLILDMSGNLATLSGVPTNKTGEPTMQPSDRGKKEIAGLTTDLDGNVNIRAAYGLSTVRPYLGIGFGRPVDVRKRVTVNFDLGVAYIGGVHVYGESYMDNYPNCTSVELNEAWINDPRNEIDGKTLREEMGEDYDEIVKYINLANKFPVLPYARLTINCRLF